MKSCFIIAPLGGENTEIRKRSDQILKYVLRPALEKCGYEAVRADEISNPGLITDQIIARLLSADLAIADLTWQNPNVFYELGIRHALGKPVIQIADSSERIPFDLSNVRSIIFDYRDLDSVFKAKELLVQAITQLEGEGDYESPVSSVAKRSREKKPRFLSVSVYLGNLPPDLNQNVNKAIELLMNALNVSIDKDFPAEEGSWFKRWMMKTNEILSRPEVSERIRKMELAIETEILKKRQAEVDEVQGKVAQALLTSLQNIDSAAVQIGSILIVKRTDADGQSAVVIRNLTSKEILLLESQPSMLQDPACILKLLESSQPIEKIIEKRQSDLDAVRDSKLHDYFNEKLSDQELMDMWVSRKIRNKKTWQMEREIAQRPGLMDRCLRKLGEVRQSE